MECVYNTLQYIACVCVRVTRVALGEGREHGSLMAVLWTLRHPRTNLRFRPQNEFTAKYKFICHPLPPSHSFKYSGHTSQSDKYLVYFMFLTFFPIFARLLVADFRRFYYGSRLNYQLWRNTPWSKPRKRRRWIGAEEPRRPIISTVKLSEHLLFSRRNVSTNTEYSK